MHGAFQVGARAHRPVGGQDARSRGHGAWKGGERQAAPGFLPTRKKSGELLLALTNPGTVATRGLLPACCGV